MVKTLKIWLHYMSLNLLILPLLVGGCQSESTQADQRSSQNELTMFEQCEQYPPYDHTMAYGEVVPPIGWSQAYRADGTRQDFSLETFFCGAPYRDTKTLILVIGAGWCQACARLIETFIDPIANTLTNQLDAELVYLEIQDTQYQPADNDFSYRHLQRLINDGPGWRVGDLDTLIRDGSQMTSAPRFISRQMNLPILPAVWVIRKRDMRIIATRELAWQSRPGELPLELIAMDPEQDWSEPPLPPFRNQCAEGDEEETNDTLNNRMQNAMRIETGIYTGGICDREPDFYTFDIEGPWIFSLTHDIRQGDLDIVLWDAQKDLAALDSTGRIIGSFTAENVETLSGEGPAIVQIRGYGDASARYEITLETR